MFLFFFLFLISRFFSFFQIFPFFLFSQIFSLELGKAKLTVLIAQLGGTRNWSKLITRWLRASWLRVKSSKLSRLVCRHFDMLFFFSLCGTFKGEGALKETLIDYTVRFTVSPLTSRYCSINQLSICFSFFAVSVIGTIWPLPTLYAFTFQSSHERPVTGKGIFAKVYTYRRTDTQSVKTCDHVSFFTWRKWFSICWSLLDRTCSIMSVPRRPFRLPLDDILNWEFNCQ